MSMLLMITPPENSAGHVRSGELSHWPKIRYCLIASKLKTILDSSPTAPSILSMP